MPVDAKGCVGVLLERMFDIFFVCKTALFLSTLYFLNWETMQVGVIIF